MITGNQIGKLEIYITFTSYCNPSPSSGFEQSGKPEAQETAGQPPTAWIENRIKSSLRECSLEFVAGQINKDTGVGSSKFLDGQKYVVTLR